MDVWTAIQIISAVGGAVGFLFVLYMSQHYISRDVFYEHVEVKSKELAVDLHRLEEKLDAEMEKAKDTLTSGAVQIEKQNAVLATLDERTAAHTRLFESTIRGLERTLEKTDQNVARVLDCLMADRSKARQDV